MFTLDDHTTSHFIPMLAYLDKQSIRISSILSYFAL